MVVVFLQVNAEILTEEGDAKTAICNVVEKLNIGMLILGDHGLGKIKRLAFLTFFYRSSLTFTVIVLGDTDIFIQGFTGKREQLLCSIC